jgi:Hsp20/alpha crystallin family
MADEDGRRSVGPMPLPVGWRLGQSEDAVKSTPRTLTALEVDHGTCSPPPGAWRGCFPCSTGLCRYMAGGPVSTICSATAMAHQMLRVEEFDQDGTLVVRAEMPGIDPDKDVEINVGDGMLSIRAERTDDDETSKRHFHRKEIRYGGFSRTVPLPQGVTEADVTGVVQGRDPRDSRPCARTAQGRGEAHPHRARLNASSHSDQASNQPGRYEEIVEIRRTGVGGRRTVG